MNIALVTARPPIPPLLFSTICQTEHFIIPYHIAHTSFPLADLKQLDLIICMPNSDDNFLNLTQEIRNHSKTPSIILGSNSSKETKHEYLRTGANYYLHYPQEADHIIKLIDWIHIKTMSKQKAAQITFKDLILDPNSQTISRQTLSFRLPNKEYKLMEVFLNHPNRILSKDLLLEEVWDINAKIQSTTLETHICQLRKKIDNNFIEKRFHTIPYSGYILR